MTATSHLRTMFGVKLTRLREGLHLSQGALARRARLSVSYLAEIEAGKKYPRTEKMLALADALGLSHDELVSSQMDAEFAPLKGFLDSPLLQSFPFERFGLPREQLVHLLARSPHEVAALLRTVNDVARQYNIGVEHFLHAALRSYQELTGNYYPDLEAAAENLLAIMDAESDRATPLATRLERWIEANLHLTLDEQRLGRLPALAGLRSIRVDPGDRLLLNPRLTPSQRAFTLAREAAFHQLSLAPRSPVSPPDPNGSFDQVLNDFKASYVAGAVLLPRAALTADLKRWFRQTRWHPDDLLALMEKYHATAESLLYRLSQLAPGVFGLKVHFLKFRSVDGAYRLEKQLNLSNLPVPAGHGGGEHYCRRWLTTRLLTDLTVRHHRHPRKGPPPLPEVGVQISRFPDETDEFFCLGLAFRAPLGPPDPVSMTIGFRMDEEFRRTVKFAGDRTIPRAVISSTCERCPLEPEACRDRVAPPTMLEQARAREDQRQALAAVLSAR